MVTRIRELRRAHGLTLEDVAKRCAPPTTPQTIGRLETGARNVSVGWLNRIANALGVEAQDLLADDEAAELRVVAILGAGGAAAPKQERVLAPPRAGPGQVSVLVEASIGDYRAGDEIWCEVLQAEEFGRGLNRDVLIPRPGGRFLFGRLINRDEEKLHLLPLEPGGRQQVVANPPWIGLASRLVRSL